ncbi:MAG: hypothetical protein RIA65_04475 [Woeseia sp.]
MRTFNSQYATLALVAGLMFAATPAANAHEPGYSSHRGDLIGHRYAYQYRSALPRSLRKNRDFLRWYERNIHRLRFESSWHHVYQRYERDYRVKHYRKSHYKAKRHDQRKRDKKRKQRRRH